MAKIVPSGGSSVMAQRREPPDALDFFPTPPWATRALFEHVLPSVLVMELGSVWEPACGEGHMAEVIKEYCADVWASDVFDYGRGYQVADFLDERSRLRKPDWIITNPPFKVALDFTLGALSYARVGVAMLVRTVWLEGVNRYEKLFSPRPPTVFAPFVERVPMTKGRWDPAATTATAYAWFVTVKNRPKSATTVFWIPPGCRLSLTKAEDYKKFCGTKDVPFLGVVA